jgi:uncharacterized SAM-binding protein YcdF (DUF218 family)
VTGLGLRQASFAQFAGRRGPHPRRRSPDDPRRWRFVRRWLVSLCLLLIAAVMAGLPVYVRPQIDPLQHADAILVLGGRDYDRYPFGIGLGEQGWAPIVVLSIDRWRTGFCATPHPHLNLRCFIPDPPTTKGEAQELHRLAANYGWRTVIVVTSRPHISRARFILEQCFDGNLVMVESPAHLSVREWAYQYVYQTAGYARAVLEPSC